jgi:hypothetical protein
MFLNDTGKMDFDNLYDRSGKAQLIIKENDKESAKRLVTSLQEPVYYNNKSFGPYLEVSEKSKCKCGFRRENYSQI